MRSMFRRAAAGTRGSAALATRPRAALMAATLAALLAGCAGLGPGTGPPSTSTLEAGPGSGYLTPHSAYLRPLREDVTVRAILTVGDTLTSTRVEDSSYVFYPQPDGLAARLAGNGLVEVYMTHDLDWTVGAGSARVSRLLLNQRTGGVLNADYLLDGNEGYVALAATTLVGPREGFLGPTLLINESSTDGPRHGAVAAVDVRAGTITELPQFGRFRHAATIIIAHSSGALLALETEEGTPGLSQLWMYAANNASDLVLGRGRLYVLRADRPEFGYDTRYASMALRNRPISGRFVPCDDPQEFAIARQPDALEQRAQDAGCLNFVRLAGIQADPDRSDAFYFTDLGAPSPADPSTGRPVTQNGRLYRAELDPIDPTRVTRLEVVLDGDESDDIFRPDNIAAGRDAILIQEDPRARGLHAARILRYDTLTRRLDPIAACAERDIQGRLLPPGTGGQWESTGITEAGSLFGEGAWLVAVQAPTDWSTPFRGSGGGQLLLMRAPEARR
ncbi:MAG TPA: hypothetical protein VFT93_07360 [Candidatus Eisenbacteria bacterium]|nr:hypothetical protein [Candidatus Eisenbacteria bacterium]